MSTPGYYRHPHVHDDRIVFVCEDDLWTVPLAGGRAVRLTTNLGEVRSPRFSPDGRSIAFTGMEDGHLEAYRMPVEGGPVTRLTHQGGWSSVVTWTPDGQDVVITTNHGGFRLSAFALATVSAEGGLPVPMRLGPSRDCSFGPKGAMVLGRFTADPARWKRYRGGTAGVLWIDRTGKGSFERLLDLHTNLASPMWIGDRIYFISDHEGIGNLYSCDLAGQDIRRHTDFDEFYARNASTDGKTIVFHAGADLHALDVASDELRPVFVEYHGPRVQTRRKFVDTTRYLQAADLHPEGASLLVTSRGQAFSMANWEGAVRPHGGAEGVRQRLACHLHDGKRFVVLSDEGGEEALELRPLDGRGKTRRFEHLDLGMVTRILPSPEDDRLLVLNNRCELILVDLKKGKGKATVLDRSDHRQIRGAAWSPDAAWVSYAVAETPYTSSIKLCKVATGKIHRVTAPEFLDMAPAFDPEGRYLYFISARVLNPVMDAVSLDYNFPRSMRPFLVTLRADLPSPFDPVPHGPGKEIPAPEGGGKAPAKGKTKAKKKGRKKDEALRIDLDGIEGRVLPFPVPEGLYGSVRGLKGKVLFTAYPLRGLLDRKWMPEAPAAQARIECWDFAEGKHDVLVKNVSGFDLSLDGTAMLVRSGNRLRVLKAAEKVDENARKGKPDRKSGWIDLSRIKVSVLPSAEWRQMYHEAWRRQRDNFWAEDMSRVDWTRIRERYARLLPRISSRSELSDLVWEMQGELGTSHAYEMGGDYRRPPVYPQGLLGADFHWDGKAKGYVIDRIPRGDSWETGADSPLAAPGVNLAPGDALVSVNGRELSAELNPQKLLVNLAGEKVELGVRPGGRGKKLRHVEVETLREEWTLRYRAWVRENRRRVHEATKGRVGYVHVPDMSPGGYAEFTRNYLGEVARDGLIFDVRHNGGGHVSFLILEKLARRRLGYCTARWGAGHPYPMYSPAGPMAALTDERAGSDGDIVSQAFKLMKLGPLIGKRTWGGVIGISVRDTLVDGGFTTQPEFSFFFDEVGWGVENYGVDPDIEVEITPQQHRKGLDPQLDRAIAEVMGQIRKGPKPLEADMKRRPNLALPVLPPRRAEATPEKAPRSAAKGRGTGRGTGRGRRK